MRNVLVIGIGNEFGGDDAAGLFVARLLKEIHPGGISILEHSGDGASLMELWKDASSAILIDASGSEAEPGTIQRFDVSDRPLPAKSVRHSSHAFGVHEAIEMSRALKQLPNRLVVFTVEGHNFSAGASLSEEVASAVDVLAKRVLQEIASVNAVNGCENS